MTYLCDHPRRPEKGQGEGKSIKVGCEARLLMHELVNGNIRVKVEAKHTNHGQ